jgi:hypothetical protein
MHEYAVPAGDDGCKRYVGDVTIVEEPSVGPAPPGYRVQTMLERQAGVQLERIPAIAWQG